MTKVVSFVIIAHMLAAGFLLERYPRLLRVPTLVGVLAYFVVAFVSYAYILAHNPDWIMPEP